MALQDELHAQMQDAGAAECWPVLILTYLGAHDLRNGKPPVDV
jgi:hypothetical protein